MVRGQVVLGLQAALGQHLDPCPWDHHQAVRLQVSAALKQLGSSCGRQGTLLCRLACALTLLAHCKMHRLWLFCVNVLLCVKLGTCSCLSVCLPASCAGGFLRGPVAGGPPAAAPAPGGGPMPGAMPGGMRPPSAGATAVRSTHHSHDVHSHDVGVLQAQLPHDLWWMSATPL